MYDELTNNNKHSMTKNVLTGTPRQETYGTLIDAPPRLHNRVTVRASIQ